MTEKNAKYYTNLGIDKTNQGDMTAALEAFNKSIELNPTWALTYFSKAIVFHNLKELEDAYENYSKAITCDENMIDAYYNRAHVMLLNENPDEEILTKAYNDLEKAFLLDENFVDAYYYAAIVKMKLKEYETAIALLNKVLQIEPNAIHSKALKKLIEQKYLKKDI
jgi:tetratricopeptide (TPR) repeat protein